jgi:hypothetical protein
MEEQELTLQERAESAHVGADHYGRRASAGDLAIDILRESFGLAAGDEWRHARNTLLRRIDEQIAEEDRERIERHLLAEKQAEVNGLVTEEFERVKKLSVSLFDGLTQFSAERGSGWRALDEKPDDIATVESKRVRVATSYGKAARCVAGCSRSAKYVGWAVVQWRVEGVDENGYRKTESALELVGMCGQHVKSQLLSFAMRRLIEQGQIDPKSRYTGAGRSRWSTTGAVESVAGHDPYALLQGALDLSAAEYEGAH